MANTIIHKQSSVVSKVPLSGVLSLGELAVNTADGKVFMKKSDNSVVEVGSTPPASELLTSIKTVDGIGSGLDADLLDGNQSEFFAPQSDTYTKAEIDATQTGATLLATIKTVDGTGSGLDADLLDGNDTAFFAPQSDTYTKAEIASMHETILSGIDWKEAVTNFADLATAYTTPDEGWTASVNAEDTVYRYDGSAWVALANGTVPLATAVIDGKLSSADFTKLQGIEIGSTGDQTAGEMLTAIKTVDGPGSGLNADLLDGLEGMSYARDVINTSNTQASDTNKYTKIARITLNSQYFDCSVTLGGVTSSHSNSTANECTITMRSKQQDAFGNDPVATCVITHTTPNRLNVGYVIVQNTPTTIVDFYVSITQAYSRYSFRETVEASSGGNVEYYSDQGWSSVPAGYVSGEIHKAYTSDNDGLSSGLDADQLHALSGTIYTAGIGRTNGAYTYGTAISSSAIPLGFSRIYTSNSSPLPNGSHGTGVTFKSLSSRGFQLICDDVEDKGLYFRNQYSNATGWQELQQVMLTVNVETTTNIDNIKDSGMYVTKSKIINYPGNRSNLTLQVQAHDTLIQQQVFNDTQIWLRRSTDTGSTWSTWSQH